MDFVNQAIKFLETNSVTEEGNEETINFLIPLFEQAGAKLVLQQVPHSLKDQSKRQFNLLAIFGDDLVDSRTKKGLLFTAPVDTCNPGNRADWTDLAGDPLKPKADRDWIYGLGAANSKLNFLAMLFAADTFSRSKFLQPLYVAATCGGESTLAGSRYLIQSGAVNPKHVIVGRPTGLKLQNTEKSLLVFQVKVSFVATERDAQEFNAKVFISSKTKGMHTSHPESRKNALENVLFFLDHLKSSQIESKLMSLQGASSLNRTPDTSSTGIVIRSKDLDAIRDRFRSFSSNNRECHYEMRLGGTGDRGVRLLPEDVYSAIKKIRDEIKLLNEAMAPVQDSSFDPDHSRVFLSSISQDRDVLELTIQMSLLPEFSSVDSRKEVERDFKERMGAIARSFKSVSIESRRVFATHRFFTDPTSTFVATLKADMTRAGLASDHRPGNFYSEAAHFAEKDYETITFGAGDAPALINCPNEKVRIDDLQGAIRFYSRAIEAFCLRGI